MARTPRRKRRVAKPRPPTRIRRAIEEDESPWAEADDDKDDPGCPGTDEAPK